MSIADEYHIFHLTYPAMVQIDEIIFDIESKSLNLILPAVEHSDYVNISIPRELLDHEDEEKFVVLVDNKQTDYTEFSTSTYRTVTFPVDVNSGIVVITGSKVIPEFGILSMFILIVGFVSILGLSLKTRLKIQFM